jgi:HD domain
MLARQQELLEEMVAERTAELADARWETLRCLALAAEYRDDQTYEHTQRVGRSSGLLAEQLGLEPEWCLLIRHAAPLHDVGKVGMPDSILLKPGKLSPDEFAIVRGHAAAGARILSGSSSQLLKLAEEIAASHHEWWDGSGYPHGLVGEEIPLSGRIVVAADVFDASPTSAHTSAPGRSQIPSPRCDGSLAPSSTRRSSTPSSSSTPTSSPGTAPARRATTPTRRRLMRDLVLQELRMPLAGGGLRSAATTSHLTATQLLSLSISHIQLAHTLTGIRVGDPDRCAFPVLDLCARHVRNPNRLASQNRLPYI